MDEAPLRFLFGTVPDAVPTTPDECADLLDADRPGASDRVLELRATVAGQILGGEHPDVWRTAQRLLDAGLSREDALDQLVGAIVFDGESADPVAVLDRLPVPGPDALAAAFVELAREHGPVPIGELAVHMIARLDLHPDDAARLTDQAEERLHDDPDGPVVLLSPDLVVHVDALTAGIVLTHRLTAGERDGDRLDLLTDLAVFARTAAPTVDGAALTPDDDGGWVGPPGWLAAHRPGDLVAVRVAPDGAVSVEAVDDEPVAGPALLMATRTAYDEETEETGLPLAAEDLVLAVLVRDPAAFGRPRPPLVELAATTGLQHRDGEFAHEEASWIRGEAFGVQVRLADAVGTERAAQASAAYELLADPASGAPALREALELLEDPATLVGVVDELAGDESPERIAALVAAGDRLVAVAGSGGRAAVAEYVAAVAAERDGRVRDAEAHLRAASLAGRGWGLVEDRLAWYESDRGEAAAAYGRWSELELPDDDPDLAMVRRFAAATGPEPGRNAPCWCGSGRKYKQCHAGRPAVPPLPERVGWLHRKAVAYLERRGGTDGDVYDYAAVRDPDPVVALADPLTLDVVLHEGGWFGKFLAERGPLLPADEAELAAAWTEVDRAVHEVVEVRPDGLTVRDLAGGGVVEVAERTAGRELVTGAVVCGRAVPDGVGPGGVGPGGVGPGGAGRRFVGGLFRVPAGRGPELAEVLATRDGAALLAWVAAAG